MTKRLLISLAIGLFLHSFLHAQESSATYGTMSKVTSTNALTTAPIAAGLSKFLGCEWAYNQASGFANYWNQITPENAGKWGSVEATRDVMNWTVLDSTFKVAKKYHVPFKLHTLIWGAQQPSWIDALDTANQRIEIEEWFAALAARYDTIDYIDVVNEPLHNAPNGMIPWGSTTPNVNYAKALGGAGTTGWDWIIRSFQLARKYFPNSKLIMNDYSIINSSSSTSQYITIINLLKARNLIDGIGEQAHAFTTYGTSASTLKANLDALAATGVPIYITEMDIDGSTDLIQYQEYKRVFPIFWDHPGIKGITMWGFRPGLWRNTEGAYLITTGGAERPALKWMRAYANNAVVLTQSINISAPNNADTIFVNDKVLMSLSVLPANTTVTNATLSATPSSVGTLDTYGYLTGVAPGKVTIKAAAWDGSGIVGTKDIIVVNRLVTSVDIASWGNVTSMYVGETLKINSLVKPSNATNKTLVWSITPSNLAQITTSGQLTALVPGTITVKGAAADGSGKYDSLNIVISARMVQTVTVTSVGSVSKVYVGDSLQMKASVSPVNATDTTCSWSVEPQQFASISTKGYLKGLAAGTVTVTATANDGSGVSGTMNVEVTDKPNGVSNANLDPVRVGPNPVTNGTLVVEGATEVKEIELISMPGETMMKLKNYNQPTINITLNVNPGIYLVRLNDGVSSIYKKIIVK